MVDENGNLPYATLNNSDIGFEWETPESGSQALSSTVYYQFALAGDNPYTNTIENLWK